MTTPQEVSSGQQQQAMESAGAESEPNSSNSTLESGSRKRAHPASLNIDDTAPPNKRLHTPTEREERESNMREKQILYKRVAEAERNPFFLHPHQHPVFPFMPSYKCNFTPMGSIYSLLHSPTNPPSPYPAGSLVASASPTTATSTSTTNIAGGSPQPSAASVTSSPRPYPSQFYSSFIKYPFSPPTPSSISSLGLLSPWNPSNNTAVPPVQNTNTAVVGTPVVATSTPRESSGSSSSSRGVSGLQQNAPQRNSASSVWQTPSFLGQGGGAATTASSTTQTTAPASIQHLMSPHSNLQSIQSPLSYFQPSPLSPMMFIQSPYASSVSSCPSVSSSSGCSSDGGVPRTKQYAPSEYHVGPRRPLCERYAEEDNQSEGANNSGRNTPSDDTGPDNSNVVLPSQVGVGPGLVASGSAPYTPLGNGVLRQGGSQGVRLSAVGRHTASPYPFSVESLSCSQPSSVDSNSQSYLASVHASASVDRPSSGVSSMSSSLSSRDSTPEPGEHTPSLKVDPHHPPQGADVFCLVPGRLSLLSSTQKYKVSVDEVRRRLSHPECLNASVLGGILRRAKSKNGGHVLRQRLESIGLSLPPGRRKATELSLLTSLVEGESLHLSSDFRRLCENFFPHSELAQIIARQHVGTPQAQDRVSMVKATQLIVSELQAMLNAVGGPSNIKPADPNNPYPGLTNFSLLTHGFGNPSINTSLGVLQTYLQELLAFYEGRKPVQPDTRYMISEKVPHHPMNGMQPHPLYGCGSGQSSSHEHGLNCDLSGQPSRGSLSLKQEPADSPNNCAV